MFKGVTYVLGKNIIKRRILSYSIGKSSNMERETAVLEQEKGRQRGDFSLVLWKSKSLYHGGFLGPWSVRPAALKGPSEIYMEIADRYSAFTNASKTSERNDFLRWLFWSGKETKRSKRQWVMALVHREEHVENWGDSLPIVTRDAKNETRREKGSVNKSSVCLFRENSTV